MCKLLIKKLVSNLKKHCLAWSVTAVYLLIIIIYYSTYLWINYPNLEIIDPSTFGSFLGGVFAPLAFFWLVFGYFQNNKNLEQNSISISQQAQAIEQQAIALQQQSESLKLQVEELNIANQSYQNQTKELKNSVQAQQNMFLLAEKQYQNYLEEKRQLSIPELLINPASLFKIRKYINDTRSHYSFDISVEFLQANVKKIIITNEGDFYIHLKGSPRFETKTLHQASCRANEKIEITFYYATSSAIPTNKLCVEYQDMNNKTYQIYYNIDVSADEKQININKNNE